MGATHHPSLRMPLPLMRDSFFRHLAFLLLGGWCTLCQASPFAYITAQKNNKVVVIDLASRRTVDAISIGKSPVGVAVANATGRIFVTNSAGHTVSVIDAHALKVTRTIPVGGYPDGIAIDPSGTFVYTVNWMDNTISVIDASKEEVVATMEAGSNNRCFGQFIGK